MKRVLLAFLAALICVFSFAKEPASVTVMSFNIRGDENNDGTNSWDFRFSPVGYMMDDILPDVVGMQEPSQSQLIFFKDNFSQYKWVGVGRNDGKKLGEFTCILYNSKKVSVGKSGTFWLSDTPDKPSFGWEADHACTAVWAVIKDKKSGNSFFMVNTHIDVDGAEFRGKAIELILKKIDELNTSNLPVVLTGGFNMEEDNLMLAPVKESFQNARTVAFQTDDVRTYHNYGKVSQKIDHIFIKGFSSCLEFKTITERYGDRAYVSDHNPIIATLIL